MRALACIDERLARAAFHPDSRYEASQLFWQPLRDLRD
jgi:hypothetical protein